MIKLLIKKKVKGKIIEKILDFDGTYDGKLLTQKYSVKDSAGGPDVEFTTSWIPFMAFDDWEIIKEIKEGK